MLDTTRTEYRPSRVSPPGATLADLLEERSISQRDLARRMGRPVKTINEIVKGKTAITQETALELELALGVAASFWNNRELRYREQLAREEQQRDLKGFAGWAKQFPASEMTKLHWISPATSVEERTRELLRFFGVASPAQWRDVYVAAQAAFRRSPKTREDAERVSAWLRRGELQAAAMDAASYDEDRFRAELHALRALTREPDPRVLVPKLQASCAAAGVLVVFTPELKGSGVSGATRWLPGGRPLIQLSLRYRTDDHLWFTFFHEAGHVLLHPRRAVFLEGPTKATREHSDEERAADHFARDVLLPPRDYHAFVAGNARPTLVSVEAFADRIGVAPGVVVGRLQHDGIYGFHAGNGLKQRFRWDHDAK